MGSTDPGWWTPERRAEAGKKRKLAHARSKRAGKLATTNGADAVNEKLKARHTGSLLERALANQPEVRRSENAYHTYEMAELALAWCRGDIDRHQAARALGCAPSAVEGKLYSALRWGLGTKTVEARMRPRTAG